ncbi:MAG: sulfite exporter TauE/SafE family protein [Gammaproteobacteria bacterium]|nr:sulfite exporter TauE/SafE family protein [Gammaproteobacteria bacterium]MBU1447418.1 sulfite exporter TauE/SafE family protein [Gammaproteobacteria bacterium]
MEWYVAYLVLGAFAGFLAGLFGVGGGLVLVPVLLLMFDAQHFAPEHIMHLALGTSMATIIFTSLASMRKHHQHGAVDWQVVRHISPGILLGTGIGALTASTIPAKGLGIFFALFVYFAATQMLIDKRPHAARQLPGVTGLSLFGSFTGWISSLVSIGGGTLIVPFLLWCNLPIRHAIGTSSAIGFPIAIGGSLGYILVGAQIEGLPDLHIGYVYLPALFWIAIATMLSAPLGARAAHRLNVELLRKLFAGLLIVLATKLLFKVLT